MKLLLTLWERQFTNEVLNGIAIDISYGARQDSFSVVNRGTLTNQGRVDYF